VNYPTPALAPSALETGIMAIPRGQTIYKKKEGILTLTGDQRNVTWTPSPGNGLPAVSMAVSSITSKAMTPNIGAPSANLSPAW
jgi:hypothetical protein